MPTILIVDDMAVFREPIAAVLRERDYQAVTASTGRAGLEQLKKHTADMILLDIAMPSRDSMELLAKVRRDPVHRRVPIIVVTELTDRDVIMQVGRLGVRDYVLKSQFDLGNLLKRIEKRLKASRGESWTPAGTSKQGPQAASAGQAEPQVTVAAQSAPGTTGSDTNTADLLKSIRPIMNRSQINEKMEAFSELKAMSPSVNQILKLTGSKDCSIDQVARTVKQDQAIALKVLKMANSVVYTRGEPVESVPKAVMRIGLGQLRQLVLNISVINRFSSQGVSERMNSDAFWEHSIATGLIAASLTRSLGKKEHEIDSAFTMGLLHDVGRMVYAEQMPEAYEQVLDTAERLSLPLERVESRMLLVNHADMMDKVLHAWKFPKQLINPIALHHLSISNIRNLARSMVTEVATVGLANRLAHAMLLGSSGNETIYPTESFINALKLSAGSIQQIESEIPDQTDDIKLTMLQAASDATHWTPMRERVKNALNTEVNPIFVGTDPQYDAYRILCDQIRSESGDQSPNIGIVHFTHVNQRTPLTTMLRKAEEEAGVGPLPLVLLSPNGNIELEERAMADRSYRLLPSTLTVWRLTDAINAVLGKTSAPQQQTTAA